MQLAVKNGSLIRNGNDLSGGCGGGGPDNCNQCVWADEVYLTGEDVAIGQSNYRWRQESILPFAARWKPGYPEALDGTLWTISSESKYADNYSTGGQRESQCVTYTIWQCVDGSAVDISEEAAEWDDYIEDNPFDPDGNTVTQNARYYEWAVDGETGEFTRACPESWVPEAWATLAGDPVPPDPILVCPQGEQWYVDCYDNGTRPSPDCTSCGAGPFATYDEANQWVIANPAPDGCDQTIINPARKNPLP